MQRSKLSEGGYQLIYDSVSASCSPPRLICFIPGNAVVNVAGVGVVDEGRERVDDNQASILRGKGSGGMHEEGQEMCKRWHRNVVEVATQFLWGDVGRIGA